jgi:magnesium-transporting ATPase (P-type)
MVGSPRMLPNATVPEIARLEAQGKSVLVVTRDNTLVGVMGATDTLRPDIPQALTDLRALGIRVIVILTGDNERVAHTVATALGVAYRANLLPEDKIQVVQEYQAKGHTVVMVGDGVNDAPALAQATVGIAMGAAGTDVALEAAHIALMRDDWSLVPEVFRLARRTMGVVKMNIGLTALYNVLGLGLAAFGLLPPIFAAAAQSIPDLGILANSSRLLRYRRASDVREPFTFDFKRWSTPLIALSVLLFVGALFLQVQVATMSDMDGMLRRIIEVTTTLVLLTSFISSLLLVLFTKINEAEEKHGGEIPLPNCACCSDESPSTLHTTSAAPLATDIIPLNQIEIK